jgi:hypothetical protein
MAPDAATVLFLRQSAIGETGTSRSGSDKLTTFTDTSATRSVLFVACRKSGSISRGSLCFDFPTDVICDVIDSSSSFARCWHRCLKRKPRQPVVVEAARVQLGGMPSRRWRRGAPRQGLPRRAAPKCRRRRGSGSSRNVEGA